MIVAFTKTESRATRAVRDRREALAEMIDVASEKIEAGAFRE